MGVTGAADAERRSRYNFGKVEREIGTLKSRAEIAIEGVGSPRSILGRDSAWRSRSCLDNHTNAPFFIRLLEGYRGEISHA